MRKLDRGYEEGDRFVVGSSRKKENSIGSFGFLGSGVKLGPFLAEQGIFSCFLLKLSPFFSLCKFKELNKINLWVPYCCCFPVNFLINQLKITEKKSEKQPEFENLLEIISPSET